MISSYLRRSVSCCLVVIAVGTTVGNAASVAKAAVVLATVAVRLVSDMYHFLVVALVSVVTARVVCVFAGGLGAAGAGVFRVGIGLVGLVVDGLGVLNVVVLSVVVLKVVVLSVVVFGGLVGFVGLAVIWVSAEKI